MNSQPTKTAFSMESYGQLLILALISTILIFACISIATNMGRGQWHGQPIMIVGIAVIAGSVINSIIHLANTGSTRKLMHVGANKTIDFLKRNSTIVTVCLIASVLALEYVLPFVLPEQASLHCMFPRWNTLTSTWPASLSQWADESTLAMPLKKFHIFSSHNSYIACSQNFTPASLKALQLNIRLGCRCIEIDAWNDGYDGLIVSHGTINGSGNFIASTSSLNFEECIKAIAECAWQSTDDPLILYVQNYMMRGGGDVMGEAFKKHMSDRMANLEGVALPEAPIGKLRGKLVLVTNGNTGTPSTDAMIHATFGSGVENYGYESAMRQESLVRQKAVSSIVRVYPDANVQTLLSHNQDMECSVPHTHTKNEKQSRDACVTTTM